MNTFQLMCFLEVAEKLSFAGAAEKLHVTQPAVSQQIRSLEEELNVKLFYRTTRAVRLTEEGKIFINDAERIIAVSDRAKKRFENRTDEDISTFSVGCCSYPCLFLTAEPLRELKKHYDNLHPSLHVVAHNQIFRMLEEGDLDVIIGFKESRKPGETLSYKELFKAPLVCVCRKDHALAESEETDLDSLRSEKLVLLSPVRGAYIDAAGIGSRLVEGRLPSELYFCESNEAVATLVEADYGVSVLPEIFVPEGTRLKAVPLKDVGDISFGIYYRGPKANRLSGEFIKKMKDFFSDTDKNRIS